MYSSTQSVSGVEKLGHVGDLKIQYLGVSSHADQQRIQVVGYLRTDKDFDSTSGKADHQSELFFLGLSLIYQAFRAKISQAIAYLGRQFRQK